MTRREALLAGASALIVPVVRTSGETLARGLKPSGLSGRPLRVAFMLGGFANVIDVAGPWEVFQDTMTYLNGEMKMPFELFTVGTSRRITELTGGLQVVPSFDAITAPSADIIVVPAQRSAPDMLAWLKRASAKAQITMSVCTGAFQLGRAGLLHGLSATTHHQSLDSFQREFPDTKVERGVRFVDEGHIITAAGLTSGIDAALHVVARLLGIEVAEQTAEFMEHRSADWQTGGASQPC